ncbi:LytR/AlgR family response regulator transcription factor [Bacillus coahuilensis]|uniref:LytR/AlgR family response regulator transcription factor n=1 Tax=Bacillus coahuilensis TaxID=408580 RepID=UPI00018513D0|nr:response regulator [Bacillus coahuilensis]
MIRVILADDNEDALEILSEYISKFPGYEVVAQCKNGDELVNQSISLMPDLIITDIQMPKLSGLEAVREISSMLENSCFIFITAYDQFAVDAFDIAAVDYVIKPVKRQRLFIAMEKDKKSDTSK